MGCEEITQRPYLHALLCSVIYHVTHVVWSEDLASYVPSLIEAQVPPSAALFPPWQRGEKLHCCILNPLRGRTMPSSIARCDVFHTAGIRYRLHHDSSQIAGIAATVECACFGRGGGRSFGQTRPACVHGPFLHRASNKLASSSAFEDVGKLFQRTSTMANFKTLPVLQAALQADLERSNVPTGPTY